MLCAGLIRVPSSSMRTPSTYTHPRSMYSSASRREHSPRSDMSLDTRTFSLALFESRASGTIISIGVVIALVAAEAVPLADVDMRGRARRARVEGLASGRLRTPAGLRNMLRPPVKRRQPVHAARMARFRRAGSNRLRSAYRCAAVVLLHASIHPVA